DYLAYRSPCFFLCAHESEFGGVGEADYQFNHATHKGRWADQKDVSCPWMLHIRAETADTQDIGWKLLCSRQIGDDVNSVGILIADGLILFIQKQEFVK